MSPMQVCSKIGGDGLPALSRLIMNKRKLWTVIIKVQYNA